MTTPAEARWKELVAQLAARVGLTPLDVEAATEGRVKADEVHDLIAQGAEREQRAPPAADGAPPVQPPPGVPGAEPPSGGGWGTARVPQFKSAEASE